jgi:hypothetical protein
VAYFGDSFRMKATMSLFHDTGLYTDKESTIGIYLASDRTTCLGEAKFNLAKYANYGQPLTDKLRVKNCTYDKNAYVEVYVNARIYNKGDRKSMRSTICSVDEVDAKDKQFIK